MDLTDNLGKLPVRGRPQDHSAGDFAQMSTCD
jgi:hypothetical protein